MPYVQNFSVGMIMTGEDGVPRNGGEKGVYLDKGNFIENQSKCKI